MGGERSWFSKLTNLDVVIYHVRRTGNITTAIQETIEDTKVFNTSRKSLEQLEKTLDQMEKKDGVSLADLFVPDGLLANADKNIEKLTRRINPPKK